MRPYLVHVAGYSHPATIQAHSFNDAVAWADLRYGRGRASVSMPQHEGNGTVDPQPMTREQGDLILSRLAELWLLLDRLVAIAEKR